MNTLVEGPSKVFPMVPNIAKEALLYSLLILMLARVFLCHERIRSYVGDKFEAIQNFPPIIYNLSVPWSIVFAFLWSSFVANEISTSGEVFTSLRTELS